MNDHHLEQLVHFPTREKNILDLIIDTGYPHDGHADKDSYPHDGRADKDSYPHDGRADKDSYPHDRDNALVICNHGPPTPRGGAGV